MDALEFLRERKRMCNSYKECRDCPLEKTVCTGSGTMPDEERKKIIATVEQWSKEHPRKTRQSVFLEQYPEAELGKDGVITLCPMVISAAHRDSNGLCGDPDRECEDCRREFWMQEVKEDD